MNIAMAHFYTKKLNLNYTCSKRIVKTLNTQEYIVTAKKFFHIMIYAIYAKGEYYVSYQ
jgi:hypothetical protein